MKTLDNYRTFLNATRQKGNTTALFSSPAVRSGDVVVWVATAESYQRLKKMYPAADIRPFSRYEREAPPSKPSVVDLEVLGVFSPEESELVRLRRENEFLREELGRLLDG
jgi:hypothetical protein